MFGKYFPDCIRTHLCMGLNSWASKKGSEGLKNRPTGTLLVSIEDWNGNYVALPSQDCQKEGLLLRLILLEPLA